MTETTAPAPAIAPALPNAAIDMNALLANDAAGKVGNELFEGALHLLAHPEGEPLTPATQQVDRDPLPGDTVTRDEPRGGWVTIRASWLADPIKVQGESAATEKVDELLALIPAPTA